MLLVVEGQGHDGAPVSREGSDVGSGFGIEQVDAIRTEDLPRSSGQKAWPPVRGCR